MRTISAWLLAAAAFCTGCGGGSSSPAAPSTNTSLPQGSVACAAINGGASSGALAILNGSACSSDNSSVVLLNMRDKSDGPVATCSGTVIASRAVLTAAHCLADSETTLVKVYRGSGLQVSSVSFHAHPGYHGTDASSLDVGVVITGDDLQRPAMPLLLSRDARVGEQAVIAGWGLDQSQVGTTLRAGLTSVTLVGPVYLQTQFGTPGGTTSGVCSGDSGGPLLLSTGSGWAIGGVTSATSGVACQNNTNFFANLRNADIRSFVAGLVPNAIVR